MLKRLLIILGNLLLLPVLLLRQLIYLLLRKLGWVSGATSNLTGLRDLSGLTDDANTNLTGLQDLSGLTDNENTNLTGLQDLSGLTLFQQLLDQANSAEARYLQTGDPTGLDDSITAWQRILQHPDFATVDADFRLRVLNNSAITYWYRYRARGEVADLDHALSGWQEAVQLPPAGSPNLPGYLNNLGMGLLDRYTRTGDLTDLQAGIDNNQRAVSLTPAGSPELPGRLNNLGNGFQYRYARTGDLTDLQAGIDHYQRAVQLTPAGSPELPSRLNNLGVGFQERYDRTGDLTDLQAGIDHYQRAVQLTPAGSPELPTLLNNLGTGFQYRYARTGDLTDLQAGIDHFQQAVSLTPAGSPELPRNLNNLGNGLSDRYARTGDLSDLQAGIDNYQRAAQRGLEVALELSLISARNWLGWAFRREAWEEVGTAYQFAYQASTRLVQTQLQRAQQTTWLKETQGLAAHAAYAYAKLGHEQDAVVTLEAGLARLLSEALAKDRTDFQQLQQQRPDLHDLYQHTLASWEQALHQTPINLDELRRQHDALEQVIQTLRTVPGYETFLLAPTFKDIVAATTHTTVVYIAVTRAGGLALLVNSTGQITPIWLADLTEDQLEAVLTGLEQDTDNPTAPPTRGYFRAYLTKDQNAAAHDHWEQQLVDTTHWLWQTLMGQLIDHLQDTTTPITLIPVGRLNVLPLHAAWTEDAKKPTGKRYALDHHLFTYAPNARTLTEARKVIQRLQTEQLLAVDDPRPVNANQLPNSGNEVNTIASTFTTPQIFRHQAATYATIHAALPKGATILHFSCHGKAYPYEPLHSGIVLADDQFLTVKDFLDLHLHGIRLATLSACETSIPGQELPEEFVNLPAGLLQAGTAGVVASLWSVDDFSTALLMARFYDYWRIEHLELGEALRQAQIWLRDTTNKDKRTYFSQHHHPTFDSELLDCPDLLRSQAHPYHWAGFGFTGV